MTPSPALPERLRTKSTYVVSRAQAALPMTMDVAESFAADLREAADAIERAQTTDEPIVSQPITLRMTLREDGGLRVRCDELPGLLLSHKPHMPLFRDLPQVIKDLFDHGVYVRAQGAEWKRKFANELRKWWSFDGRQHHTHSWHSREDFITKRLPELLAAAPSFTGMLAELEECFKDNAYLAPTVRGWAQEHAIGISKVIIAWHFWRTDKVRPLPAPPKGAPK